MNDYWENLQSKLDDNVKDYINDAIIMVTEQVTSLAEDHEKLIEELQQKVKELEDRLENTQFVGQGALLIPPPPPPPATLAPPPPIKKKATAADVRGLVMKELKEVFAQRRQLSDDE